MPQISLQQIYRFSFLNKSKRGFTLIEILIAVAIFVTTLTFILPQVNRSENNIKKSLRDLQALNRTLYSYSRIRNRTYRLALQADPQESSYWVEVKKNPNTSLTNTANNSLSIEDPENIEHPFFKKDQNILKKQRTLPSSIQFYWEKDPSEDLDSNVTYITYDPHSFSPPSTIQIKASHFTWNLFFNPLSGELEILGNEGT